MASTHEETVRTEPPNKRQRLEEPTVRQAEEEEEYRSQVTLLPEASAPLNDAVSTMMNTPIAPRISDYLAPGGTLRYRPRLEWLSPASHRKRSRSEVDSTTRKASSSARTTSRRAPDPPAAAAAGQPDNGLLPNYAFAQFMVEAALPAAAVAQPLLEAALPAAAVAQPLLEEDAAQQEASSPSGAIATRRTMTATMDGQHAFGKDYDSALHMAIREGVTDAALQLIQLGAAVGAENAKRVTPLILAAQKGLYAVTVALIQKGANPLAITVTGSTALLQAAHFGRCRIVELLLQNGAMMEMANYNNTTPLMRASQEGHTDVVRLLLKHGARVNRRNNEHMSALMLASQRGHADIVRHLLDHRAGVDAMTAQKSTSLMLACKREHLEVVRVLVTAGCELEMKDTRGRTAKEVAQRRNSKELLQLLEPSKQVELMQCQSRVERNYFMAKMWNLLQQDRAKVQLIGSNAIAIGGVMSIHELSGSNSTKLLAGRNKCDEALLRTMALPAPMVELIASYMPLPRLWETRLMLITKRCSVDADAAISCTFDLIDEVLEEGGFLEACAMAKITPPVHFDTWDEWRSWGIQHNHLEATPALTGRVNSLTATLPGMPKLNMDEPPLPVPMNARDWRRGICYLQILAHRSPLLQRVLLEAPFKMPSWIVDQLITVNDIQSLSRRLGPKGARFEATVAIELVMLASSVVAWYNREISSQSSP